MKIFINCTEANTACDKNQYNEASFLDKVALNIHLLWCKLCRKYSSNNNKLTTLIKSSDIKTMPQEDKDVLKEFLQREVTQ